MTDKDRDYLKFGRHYEQRFLRQKSTRTSLETTLDLAWQMLSVLPESELSRISDKYVKAYYKRP
jgi:V/A-type H+-transporting ATPase subunit B